MEDSKIGDVTDEGGHGAAPSIDKLSTTADIWSAADVELLAPSAGLLENNGMLVIGDSFLSFVYTVQEKQEVNIPTISMYINYYNMLSATD